MERMFFSVITLCASVTMGYACSCLPVTSADNFCRKDMILRGTALAEYKERDPSTDVGDSWMLDQTAQWVYTIRIDEVFWAREEFKGLERITVTTHVADSLCGTRFDLDVPYIFCVVANNGTFTTGLCDPNASWDHAGDGDKEFISSLIPRYCARQKVKNAKKPAP